MNQLQKRKKFMNNMLGSSIGNYGREMKITAELFKTYEDDFLLSLSRPFKALNSLVYFKSEKGKKYLYDKKNEFNYQPPVVDEIILHDFESQQYNKKKKNLREFLDE